MELDHHQLERATGTLLGVAVGDALGVPYEYGSRSLVGEAQMLGGGLGGIAPGQWSDDTEMTTVILQVTATGADLSSESALEEIAQEFLRWYGDHPPDIGIQTRYLLSHASKVPGPHAPVLRRLSAELHAETGRTAGNGSLMRTAPVALAHLGDTPGIIRAARAVSSLTHHDPSAGAACVLWCLAIDHAVRTGELDVRVGLPHVGPVWAGYLDEAEKVTPEHYAGNNGWVVAALQGAWSAIHHSTSLSDGLQRAVAGGGDTDTVAAIAGALLGAYHGVSTIPQKWQEDIHGWPGLRGNDLARLARESTQSRAS